MANISTKSYWALSALSVSNLRALPDHTSELVSQAMMGTPLKVMEFADKFYRVETPEHYMGWMDAKGLQLLREQEMMAWKRSERYFYNTISGCAFQTADPKSAIVSDLVLGDVFEGEPDSKGFLKMRFPDGRIGYAGRDECISFQDWISMEPDVGSVLSFALQMLGFPYLWGGASSKASDCSGFVKLVYYTQGIILARDSSQQAQFGEPVDISRLDNLQPGDLLFFGSSEQRIHHVGLYLGKGDFIHSSGRVQIGSIVPGDPKHDPARNPVAARRIIRSTDTEGIVRVRGHGWYGG